MKTECLEAGKDENGGFISTAVLVLVTEGDKGKFEISEMKLWPHYCSLFFPTSSMKILAALIKVNERQ